MELLTYLLKVSACTVLFFAFYLLVLRKLTFFRTNRFYLLITLLLSFIIPSLNFTIEQEVAATAIVYEQPTIANDETQVAQLQIPNQIEYASVQENLDWYALLPYFYFGIVSCLLFIATWRILQLVRHTKNGAERINGLKIVSKTKGFTNCSFFNYVFIDNKNLTEAELQVLLKHEQVHAKQLHSIDKVLLIIAKAFLWFNPVVYLYDKALEQAHEYEADEATSQSFGTAQYANLLLRLAIAKSEMPLVHNFVKSPIKARIKMLFNSKSKNMKKLMYLLALPIGLGLLWGFTVKVVEVSKATEVTEIKMEGSGDLKTEIFKKDPLWNKTIKGKIKSILITEVGEVLNFKYDNGLIRVFNYAKGKVSIGDELSISISGSITDLGMKDPKGNVIKKIDAPCYLVKIMRTLDGKVLFDLNNIPFLSKKVTMQYGQYKSERITLNTVSGKILSVKIVHGVPDNEPSKVFIYSEGKLYAEEETSKFDKKFIAKLSEKRGFSKAQDYNIPSLNNEKNAYVFWFGNEPKLSDQTSKSRKYAQKYNGKTIDGQIVEFTYSPTTKVMDGFIIKTTADETLKANVEAKFAEQTKTIISKGDKINVKIYNANYIPNLELPLLTSYKLMKDGKLLFDRWPKIGNDTKQINQPNVEMPKPILEKSKGLTVDTKTNIHYVKNGLIRFGKQTIEAEGMVYDKTKQKLEAPRATITHADGTIITGKDLKYDFIEGKYTIKQAAKPSNSNNNVYQLLSTLKYEAKDSIEISKVGDRATLYGKVKINIDGVRINASRAELIGNSNLIVAHSAVITNFDGSKVNGDVLEFDIVTKKATIANPTGSLYKR